MRYFLSHNMLIGCFFWEAILGAHIIFWGDPYLNSTTVLFDYCNRFTCQISFSLWNYMPNTSGICPDYCYLYSFTVCLVKSFKGMFESLITSKYYSSNHCLTTTTETVSRETSIMSHRDTPPINIAKQQSISFATQNPANTIATTTLQLSLQCIVKLFLFMRNFVWAVKQVSDEM